MKNIYVYQVFFESREFALRCEKIKKHPMLDQVFFRSWNLRNGVSASITTTTVDLVFLLTEHVKVSLCGCKRNNLGILKIADF
jgi:hypothetical protein